MIRWFYENVFTLGIRTLVTLAACFTLQHVIISEGYRVEFSSLLVGAACVIVVTRFWAAPQDNVRLDDR